MTITPSLTTAPSTIQTAFMQFSRRAEKVAHDVLVETFVDAEPLFIQLSSPNNQVLYGRRGTGKTHALKYLSESLIKQGDVPIYLDLRVVGSNGAIYSDPNRPLAERATRLVTDVLQAVENELIQIALQQIDSALHPEQITSRIDELSISIRNVEVKGTVEKTSNETIKSEESSGLKIGATVSTAPKLSAEFQQGNKSDSSMNTLLKEVGSVHASLDFGTLQTTLSGLIEVLGKPRIWLLLDEWSEIPIDLQPYLADLLRRTILPQENVILKIAAIEHRSLFSIKKSQREYIGIEIGADVTADINLDDFVVYDADQQKATEFYKNLIFRHYKVSDKADASIKTPDDLINAVFTRSTAFQEYVRAIEGVPRDALNLAATVARIAYGKMISVDDVRRAAREWYNQDKMSATKSNERLGKVLNYIIAEVIENRRTRAFLFPSNITSIDIEYLYDARLLHILKKSVSSNDEPGKRYDVYKIDYGCYVDLVTTTKAPQALFTADDGISMDVPPDDYRSIRRAILLPEDLAKIS